MNKFIYDCIIIGSGPAALTAGIYMARAGYKINIVTGEHLGGSLTFIPSLENYPGIPCIPGGDLVFNMIQQCEQLGIDITYYESVKYFYRIGYSEKHKHIKPSDMLYSVYAVFLGNQESEDIDHAAEYENADLYAKSVIIATGTIPNKLHLENEDKFFEHGLHFCASCDGAFYKNKNVFVLGGGNTAFNDALYLSKLCKEVTIVHRRNEFRAEKAMIDKCKNKVNIKFLMNSTVVKYIGDNKLEEVVLNVNGTEKTFKIDGIFYALGMFKNNIIYHDFNNEYTNIRLFNAGDSSLDPKYHQVIIAAGDGAKAAIDCIASLK